MMLLFPADVLRPRRVDEHFAGEAHAARALGWPIALLDHDAVTNGGDCAEAIARVPGDEVVIYRGWMFSSRSYDGLAAAFAARGTRLYTDAEQYRRGHELPGWYAALAAFTPASSWSVGAGRDGFDAARSALGPGPAVVRDYSKSMKHYWHEATYIPELADATAAWTVAARMTELRADDFTGGYVLRRYEPFTGAEVRTWWMGGTCRLVTAHPDTPNDPPPDDLDLTALYPVIAGLDLPFVTVDLARRTDGMWRVVELGDGQVSDWPATTPPEDLVTVLPQT
jgi:hypothetical protein